MSKVLKKDKGIVKIIPSSVLDPKIKKEFLRCRQFVMRRTYLTEANNKILRDWTHDKMLDIYKEKEKERIATEMFIASQKLTSMTK